MIHSTSPSAASAKWLRIRGGRMRLPASRACCMPPRATQIESRTKPPAAVRIQRMRANHSMVPPQSLGSRSVCPVELDLETSAAPAVRDREAPVAPEGLRPQLHTGRGLPPLVLGAVDHGERAVDDLGVEAVAREVLPRLVELDVRLEHSVQLGVGRQRVLVELPGV